MKEQILLLDYLNKEIKPTAEGLKDLKDMIEETQRRIKTASGEQLEALEYTLINLNGLYKLLKNKIEGGLNDAI